MYTFAFSLQHAGRSEIFQTYRLRTLRNKTLLCKNHNQKKKKYSLELIVLTRDRKVMYMMEKKILEEQKRMKCFIRIKAEFY